MKKQLLAPLFLLSAAACSDSAESPVIEITGLFVEGDIKDYSEDIVSLPSLKVGDEVSVSLKLDGNGEDLNTFIVKEDRQQLKITDFDLPEEISSDKNFTRPEEGIIKFEDGVRSTELKVSISVQTVADADAILSFYLSSKAECEGAQEKIELKTEEDESESSF